MNRLASPSQHKAEPMVFCALKGGGESYCRPHRLERFWVIHGLLISQSGCSVPVFDTTCIHAEAAVEYSLSGKRSTE